MQMLINGKFIDSKEKIDVINPFNNEIIDHVPAGTPEDVKTAINSAYDAKNDLQDFSARKVSESLARCAEDLFDNLEEFATYIWRNSTSGCGYRWQGIHGIHLKNSPGRGWGHNAF